MPDTPFRLQNLPPEAAHFCLGIERFCRDDLGVDLRGAKVLVAHSGGADSLALLLVLHMLAPRLNLTVAAATLDHALRSQSAAEVDAARELCCKLGIAFFSDRQDVASYAAEHAIGLEEAARDVRAVFLETIRLKNGYQWIAQGHQLNDLAEDSLMRMTRGSGWPALAGMNGVDRDRHLVRPLLLTPRSTIEAFVSNCGLEWVMDAMNADTAYFRNRVRHTLLPLFIAENPSFLDTVASRWRLARLDADYWAHELEKHPFSTDVNDIFVPREQLASMHKGMRLRLYKRILDTLGPGQVLLHTVLSLDAAWHKNQGRAVLQFPGGKKAMIQNGGIRFGL